MNDRPLGLLSNPLTLLRAAIQQVPAVKYALAVGGVAAVVAIVLLGWKVDPRVAVFGTLIAFIFMVVMVIFAALAKVKGSALRIPALFLAWAFLILTVVVAGLFASCAFFDKPKSLECLLDSQKCGATGKWSRTVEDQRVLDLMDQILVLRGDFEARNQNPGAARKVRVDGVRLAEAITSIRDSGLNPSRRIIKHEYAGWAMLMAARANQGDAGRQRRVEHAQAAITSFDSALAEMASVKTRHAEGDEYAAKEYEWMTGTSQDLNRTNYLKAIAIAVLAREGVSGYTPAAVHQQLTKVTEDYLEEYPLSNNPELAWASAAAQP